MRLSIVVLCILPLLSCSKSMRYQAPSPVAHSRREAHSEHGNGRVGSVAGNRAATSGGDGVSGHGAGPERGEGIISGVVRSKRGKPLLAFLTARRVEESLVIGPPFAPQVPTDHLGRFRLSGLPVGRYQLLARAPSKAFALQIVTLNQGELKQVSFMLGAEARIAGAVQLSDDRPAAGAEVTLQALLPIGPPRWHTQTDEQGQFVVLGLRPGHYGLSVKAEGHLPLYKRSISVKDSRLSLKLEPAGMVQGLLHDECTVKAASQKPAPAANVTVVLAGSGAWPPRWTTSRRDGSFLFSDLPLGTYELEAYQEKGCLSPRKWLSLGRPAPVKRITLAIKKGLFLRGAVRSATGRPIAGARLKANVDSLNLLCRATLTDRHGRYSLGPLVPGRYLVQVAASGFESVDQWVELETSRKVTGDIELGRGCGVEGKVVDRGGRPVAGARIIIDIESPGGMSYQVSQSLVEARIAAGWIPGPPEPPPYPCQLVSDSRGRFSIGGLTCGRMTIKASHSKYVTSEDAPSVHLDSGQSTLVALKVQGAASLYGTVLHPMLGPINGAEVFISDSLGAYREAVCFTDRQGRFEALGLRPGIKRLEVRAHGFIPAQAAPFKLGVRESRDGLRIFLKRGLSKLAGRVFDPHGNALPGVAIIIESERATDKLLIRKATDDSGAFKAVGLPHGPFTLRLSHRKFAVLIRRGLRPGEDHEFTLSPGGTVHGTVSDKVTGNSIKKYWVMLKSGVFTLRRAISSRSGSFKIPKVPAGRHQLSIASDSHVSWSGPMVIRPDESTELNIQIAPGGTITGQVSDEYEGTYLGRVRLSLEGPFKQTVSTDRQGRFAFKALPGGTYTVIARRRGYLTRRMKQVEVAVRETRRIELSLRPLGEDLPADKVRGGLNLGLLRQGSRVAISHIPSGGSAEQAGLSVGDIIVAVDDRPVGGKPEVAYRLLTGLVGSRIHIRIARKDKLLPLIITREATVK